MFIAVMGYGVVGSGVVEVFHKNKEGIARRAGTDLALKYILDIRDFSDNPYAPLFTKRFDDILQDPEVRVVAEVMGGIDPAYDYVRRCLQAGKHVVTSNKELVAQKGVDLLRVAKEHNVNFLFEASVGGGIPIIRPMSQCLAANEIDEVAGILNGTTNFILTKMIRDKIQFEDALKMAQELGYAERNPSADIDGLDSCRKICILASLAFGKHVYPDQVYTYGISQITLEDVEYADSFGGVIKLLGQAKKLEDGRIFTMVSPVIVDRHSQFAGVEDVFNAILVRGDATGDVVFYGKGAGKLPTASAVAADIIDCVKHEHSNQYIGWEDGYPEYVIDHDMLEASFYIRILAEDPEDIGRRIKNIPTTQILTRKDMPPNEFAFVTPTQLETQIKERLKAIPGIQVLNIIRVTDY